MLKQIVPIDQSQGVYQELGIPHGHEALGSFSNDDGDGNENVKREIDVLSKIRGKPSKTDYQNDYQL